MRLSAILKVPLTFNLSARGARLPIFSGQGSDYVRKPLTLISKRNKAMKAKIFFAGLLFAVLFSTSSSYSGVPQMINYQGKVTDDQGNPLNGNYDMIFSIYDALTGGNQLWSETQPEVSVENGIFSVLLGSTTPEGIPLGVFNGEIRYLEVQVGSDLMTPRKEMVSVPYAFATATSVGPCWQCPANGITWLSDPTDNVGIGTTAPITRLDVRSTGANWSIMGWGNGSGSGGVVGKGEACGIGGESVNGTGVRGWSDNGKGVRSWSENGWDFYGDGPKTYFSGNVGIGTTDPQEKLHVIGSVKIEGLSPARKLHVYRPSNDVEVLISTGGVAKALLGFHTAGYGDAAIGMRTNNNGLALSGVGRDLDVASNVHMSIRSNGNVGIGTTEPLDRLHISGNARLSSGNWIMWDGGSSDQRIYGTGGLGIFFDAPYGTPRMHINDNGNVGIGTMEPEAKLHVNGAIKVPLSQQTLLFNDPNESGAPGDDAFRIKYDPDFLGTGTEDYLVIEKTDGNAADPDGGIAFVNTGNDDQAQTSMIIKGDGNIGIGKTNNLEAKLSIKGENVGGKTFILGGYDESDNLVVEIGKGLDYSETFPASQDGITPGMVMVIDPVNKGFLTISTQAYDSKVAGIVAGAKGLGSGVRLGSSAEDGGDHAVALAGRVYCNVDTRYGDIEAGDLLTTSPTPGHAMVVKDFSKAQGAILGKAMERLSGGGRGQILVLVTLQ